MQKLDFEILILKFDTVMEFVMESEEVQTLLWGRGGDGDVFPAFTRVKSRNSSF